MTKTYTYWAISPSEFEKAEFSRHNKETQTVTLDGITLADYYNDNDHEDGTFAKIENGQVVIRNEYEDNAVVEVWGFEEN